MVECVHICQCLNNKQNLISRAVAIEYFSNRVFYRKSHRLIKQSDKNYFFFLKSNPKYTRENKTSLLMNKSSVSFLEKLKMFLLK